MPRRPKPEYLKALAGTLRKPGVVVPIVEGLTDDPIAPDWLTGRVLEVWHERVASYRARGIAVGDCAGALAQHCALEADIIERWTRGETPSAPQLRVADHGARLFRLAKSRVEATRAAGLQPLRQAWPEWEPAKVKLKIPPKREPQC